MTDVTPLLKALMEELPRLSPAKLWRVATVVWGKRRRPNEERDRTILARVMAGETRAALAAELGVSHQRISHIVQTLGLPSNHAPKWSEELSREAVALRAEGLSLRQIGDRVHRTPDAVGGHLRKKGASFDVRCEGCGSLIEGAQHRQRFCSRRCQRAARHAAIASELLDRRCEACGGPIEGAQRVRRFCSPRCYRQAWNRRRATAH